MNAFRIRDMKCLVPLVLIIILFANRAGAADGKPAFPLKVSENRRHLVDQHGKPFFILADTPWFIQKLQIEDVRMLMDDRVAKSFNGLVLEVLDDSRIPSRYGNAAFQTATDITRPVDQTLGKPRCDGFQ